MTRSPDSSSRLGPLRFREFRLLFLSRTTSVLGDGLVPVALAFAVLEITTSASAVGLVLGARWLGMVVFLLVGGVWGDRLPRRQVMVVADLALVATQCGSVVLLLTGQAEVWHLAVPTSLPGTAAAFFIPASTGLVPHTVPPERLQQANGLLSVASSVASITGPPIAGALVATVGAGFALALDAASFLVSALFLVGLRAARDMPLREPASPFLGELAAGWREFRSRTWLWAEALYSAVANFAVLAPYSVLGPVVAETSLGGAGDWALIVTAFATGEVVGGLAVLRVRPGRPLLLGSILVAGMALPVALLAAPAPAEAIAVAALLGGLGLAAYNTLFETTLQQHVPGESLSRVSSFDLIASIAIFPLGYAAAGVVAGVAGVSTTLWGAAIVMVASATAAVATPSIRAVRRLDTRPDTGAESPVAENP